MKKLVFILMTFIFSQSGFAAETKTYVRAEYGIGKFTSDKLDSLNANPAGNMYGVGFGARMAYVEVGGFFKKSKFDADITHDGTSNKILHDGSSFGLDMNVFLNNHLALKFGYAFNRYTQKLETPLNAVTTQAIKTLYGMEDRNSSNIFYGGNIDIFGGKRWDMSVSVVHYPMGEGKSSTAAALGIRLYMDHSLADFFGAN